VAEKESPTIALAGNWTELPRLYIY